jgi:hypothetical protein
MEQSADQRDRAEAASPIAVRTIATGAVILLLLGAAYLIAVRYEAILADLSSLAAWCL